jgi:type IX secretion system PorP/SprF family membrane protein
MIKIRYTFLYILTIVFFGSIHAQDPIFTQFHSIPTLLNPSFSGADGNSRISTGYRIQWPNDGYKITTQFASFDTWSETLNSGLGISVRNHKENLTSYNFTQVDLTYSYHVELNNEWTFFPGLSSGFGIKNFNFQGLLLEDQINISTGSIGASNDPLINNDQIKFIDFSAGFLFYNEYTWFGGSIKHINKPNISFSNEGNLPLPIFFSFHGGYLIEFAPTYRDNIIDRSNLFLTFNYMQQALYNRLDFGTQLEIDNLSLGVFVSSIPKKIDENSHTISSINTVLGFKIKDFKVGFSKDFTTSKIGKTGGTYEFTFQYNFENPLDGFRRPRRLKCILY